VTELSPQARAILNAAARADDPSPEDRARVRRSLAIALASGTGAGAASAQAATAALATSAPAAKTLTVVGVSKLAKLIALSSVIVSTFGVGVYLALPHSEKPAPSPAARESIPAASRLEAPPPETEPEPTAPPKAAAQAAPSESPSPIPRSRAAKPSHGAKRSQARPAVSVPAREGPEILEELRGLDAAEVALKSGAPERALALLDQHQSRFSASSLWPERTALRIHALCQAGRASEARTLFENYLHHPESRPYAYSIRGSCAFPGGE
jgi:hypothetical protein